jgi:hypothetical protein
MHQMLMGGPGRSPASVEGPPNNSSITATPTRPGDAQSKGNYGQRSGVEMLQLLVFSKFENSRSSNVFAISVKTAFGFNTE